MAVVAIAGLVLTALGLKEAAGATGDLLEVASELLFDGAGKRVLEDVHARLRAYAGKVPPNHDLEHAIRLAELTSSLVLLESYGREKEADPDNFDHRAALAPRFITAARLWLYHQLGLVGNLKVKSNDALVDALEERLDRALAAPDLTALRAELQETEARVWIDLKAGAASQGAPVPPEDFAALFLGQKPDKPGWSVVFRAFMREALKKNPRAQVAFITTRLASLRSAMDRLEPKLDAILRNMAALRQEILGAVAASPGETVRLIMAELDARGVTRKAAEAGLERQAMLRIAGRLRPDENLDFDQAVVEVEHAVGIALDVIARGERGGNLDAFVEAVLRRLAETTRAGEFDRGSLAVDDALRDLDPQEAEQFDAMRRSRMALLEAGIEQDTLRRDAAAVAQRIEALVAVEQPSERPAWTPAFRQRRDALYTQGRDKGVNFSLEVATALAQRMLDTARDSDERGTAGNVLGNALWMLGERESGIIRLEEAVGVYRAALLERPREYVPRDWAMMQNNLGNALSALGERERGTALLEQAVEAFRAALLEYTRERVPLNWAMTQNNLGTTLISKARRAPERHNTPGAGGRGIPRRAA